MTRPAWILVLVPLLAGCMECPYEKREAADRARQAAQYVPPDKSVNVQPPMRY